MESELKRKREVIEPDSFQFSMHARHCWLAQNSSSFKLPWEFRMLDQFDVVDRAHRNMFRTLGAMPPLPVLEGSPVESVDDSARYGTADPCFDVKALQNAHKRSWQEQVNYERRCAYRKWISIVSSNPLAFEVARLQILSGPWSLQKGA